MSNEPSFTPKQLIELNRVMGIAPSPCGTWLAASVGRLNAKGNGYIRDIWRVSLVDETPSVQLTFGDSNDISPCFRHDGSLGFLSNRTSDSAEPASNEQSKHQVWILNPHNEQELKQITSEPLGVDLFKFASHGDLLAVIAKDNQIKSETDRHFNGSSVRRYTKFPIRDYSRWLSNKHFDDKHLIIFDAKGDNRRDLTLGAELKHRYTDFDISGDGLKLVITVAEEAEDHDFDEALMLFDILSDQNTLLGKQPLTQLLAPRFSPDGNLIACEHHIRPKLCIGNPNIQIIDIESQQTKTLVENGDYSLALSGWSTDGMSLIFTESNNGQKPIFRVNIESGNIARVTSSRVGGSFRTVSTVAESGIVCVRSSFVEPPEPYFIDTKKESEPKKLAHFSGADKEELEKSLSIESISFESTDGVQIQTYFLKPRNGQEPLPTIFCIHGGPISAWNDEWSVNGNPLIAAARGYASVLINPRGSTGFGQAFVEDIRGNVWGERCYKDIMEAVDFYSNRQDVDKNRLAVDGHSFGGYMTNWIGANTDRFRCLITGASIFSLSTYFSTTDVPWYWHRLLNMADHPFDNLEECDKYSPHRRVSNWKSPTLIMHGEKDYRVPISEGLSLFEALKYHGIDAELAIFPDEGHAIMKPENTRAYLELVGEFLDKHML